MSAPSPERATTTAATATSAPAQGFSAHVGALARRAGRGAIRASGMATARWRPAPEFVIIGAKRCGTTSLFRYLGAHPQVAPLFPSARFIPMMRSDQKGVHYFDSNHERGSAWYRAHFRSGLARRRAGQITGEASPYYLFHPRVPALAAGEIPQARLIALLRDPVERTYSHWSEQRRNGVETLSFEDALAAEPARLEGELERLLRDRAAVSFPYEQQSYALQSEYVTSLERWLEYFDLGHLLVLRSEDLYADPQNTYNRVTSFLGLDEHTLANPEPWNAAPRSALADDTREALVARFAPSEQRLRELVDPLLRWDR